MKDKIIKYNWNITSNSGYQMLWYVLTNIIIQKEKKKAE